MNLVLILKTKKYASKKPITTLISEFFRGNRILVVIPSLTILFFVIISYP